MIDDWDKLSERQKRKINNLKCNNWSDVKVFLIKEDNRANSDFKKQKYGTIKIVYNVNCLEKVSYISQQCGDNIRKYVANN